jgi:hypothetical protein
MSKYESKLLDFTSKYESENGDFCSIKNQLIRAGKPIRRPYRVK